MMIPPGLIPTKFRKDMELSDVKYIHENFGCINMIFNNILMMVINHFDKFDELRVVIFICKQVTLLYKV